MGEAFYGRTQAYRTALAADDREVLARVVTRNIYDGAAASAAVAGRLAAYMREAVRDLKGHHAAGLEAGELRLPDPLAIPFVEDKGDGLED